ncbi:hypothetical protein [Pseudobacteriovorax antillogorgiicola]|uniref:Peptidase family S41 n=1 Tax=Pseudobacteriovorax antillogorgiicola TaxID=1513793 RepID=A0A1Y6BWK9_9BACT|nr:hypothetical protein [Pseudobacteriovorax antillogorgiicola]TCS53809.1 hypothetical protein EDD56_107118 [Pseudobacteriovorax antillogorgiicola]SMF22039.1 hypothetical protein SAMN06296036_107154 [Pseudobacteriovorax antillogorgiicola]
MQRIVVTCYVIIANICLGQAPKNLIQEVRQQLSQSSVKDLSPWQENLKKLEAIQGKEKFDQSKLVTSINLALAAGGIAGPSLVPQGNLITEQHSQMQSPYYSGVITERKGRYFYVKYVVPKSPAAKLGLRRGDRLDQDIPFASAKLQSLTLMVKKSPLDQALKVSLSFAPSPDQLLTQWTLASETVIPLNKKHSASYLHLIDCSSSSSPILKNHLDRSRSRSQSVIIDLRDSSCDDEDQALSNLLASPLKDTPIYLLSNHRTRQGAERLLARIKEKRPQTFTIGELTAGQWANRSAQVLSSGLILLIPERKVVQAGFQPDHILKDGLLFSEGNDQLLQGALSWIKDQNS